MDYKNTDNLKPKGYETPSSYVFGWFLIAFSFIPFLIGLLQKQKILIIIGLSLIILGILLLLVGKFQSKKLLKKFNNKNLSQIKKGNNI